MLLRMKKLQKLMYESGGSGIVKYSANNNNITYLTDEELNIIDNSLSYTQGSRLLLDGDLCLYEVPKEVMLSDIDIEYLADICSECLRRNEYRIRGLLATMSYEYEPLTVRKILENEERTPNLTESIQNDKAVMVRLNEVGAVTTAHGKQDNTSASSDFVTTNDSDTPRLAQKTESSGSNEAYSDVVSSEPDKMTETKDATGSTKTETGTEKVTRSRSEQENPQKLIEEQRAIVKFSAYFEIAKIIAHEMCSGLYMF